MTKVFKKILIANRGEIAELPAKAEDGAEARLFPEKRKAKWLKS